METLWQKIKLNDGVELSCVLTWLESEIPVSSKLLNSIINLMNDHQADQEREHKHELWVRSVRGSESCLLLDWSHGLELECLFHAKDCVSLPQDLLHSCATTILMY